MKNSPETKEENSCTHCGRVFIRENTLIKHLCEQKRRWLDRDKSANRIGYITWKNYFNIHHPGKKNTEYVDFIKNSYYSAFVKFGLYCVEVGVINPSVYATYLQKNRIPIDTWTSDRTYTKYLVDYLRTEDALDSVKRSMDTLLEISNNENIRLEDVFKYIHANKICHNIVSGKISPWVLYHSRSGVEFLGNLTQDQTRLIIDYIDPERWTIKFRREADTVATVKDILDKINL